MIRGRTRYWTTEDLRGLYDQRGENGEPSQAEKENFTAPKDDLTLLLEVSNLKLKVEKLEANAHSSERSKAYLARLLGAVEARVDLLEIHRKRDRGEECDP